MVSSSDHRTGGNAEDQRLTSLLFFCYIQSNLLNTQTKMLSYSFAFVEKSNALIRCYKVRYKQIIKQAVKLLCIPNIAVCPSTTPHRCYPIASTTQRLVPMKLHSVSRKL